MLCQITGHAFLGLIGHDSRQLEHGFGGHAAGSNNASAAVEVGGGFAINFGSGGYGGESDALSRSAAAQSDAVEQVEPRVSFGTSPTRSTRSPTRSSH